MILCEKNVVLLKNDGHLVFGIVMLLFNSFSTTVTLQKYIHDQTMMLLSLSGFMDI